MHVEDLRISGLKLISPRLFQDTRGFFLEQYHQPGYAAAGIECGFVQTNHSRSLRGTIRGLHYQRGQAKLVSVVRGRIFDVVVDLRPGSPTFGEWDTVTLDDEKHQQLFVPDGFAHGFSVLSDVADVVYQITSVYDPQLQGVIRYDDHELAIPWSTRDVTISRRDADAESFAAFKARLDRQGGA